MLEAWIDLISRNICKTFVSISGKYWCTKCDCYYDNVNNFVFHQRIHQLPDEEDNSNSIPALTSQ